MLAFPSRVSLSLEGGEVLDLHTTNERVRKWKRLKEQ